MKGVYLYHNRAPHPVRIIVLEFGIEATLYIILPLNLIIVHCTSFKILSMLTVEGACSLLIMSSKISVCNWWLQHRTLTLQSACPSLPAALFPVTAISVNHTIRFQEIHLSLQMTALTTIGICPRVPRFSLHKLTTRIARIPTKPKMSRKMLQLLLEMTVSLFHINNLN
jgi:hypothetical protein